MNKQKTLLILPLLLGFTGISLLDSKIDYINSKLALGSVTNYDVKLKKESEDEENDDTKNYEDLNNLLDKQLQNNIFSYFNKDISLTALKKTFKKNVQIRKKIHQILLQDYNESFWEETLALISKNSTWIQQVQSLRSQFLNREFI